MRKIGSSSVCPYCRNEKSAPQKEPYLPLKTVVGGRYLIGKVVDSNGEGSTYNAFDMETKRPVTLRELYPKGLLTRGEGNYCLVNVGKASEFIDAKDDFVKLWRKLATLTGYKALTPATDIFEDLGTVYAVTEFLGEGQTLREYLLNKEQGYISWEEARVLFMPVLSALGELHAAGIVHGGISPTTLVIDANGKLRITGYCIPAMRTEKTSMESELFDGYAAVEQYGMSAGLGAYTDIYAFAAVLYRALIGSTPMSAASRLTNDKLMIPGKFAEQLPAYVINALVNALQILPQDRTATAEQLRDEVSASPAAAGTAAEAYSSAYATVEDIYSESMSAPEPFDEVDEEFEEYQNNPQPVKKSTIAVLVVSAILFIAILITVLAGFGSKKDGETDLSTSEISLVDDSTDLETEEATDVISIRIPDFYGEKYDDVKNNEEYKGIFIFKTEYEDSTEERGTIISQDKTAGREVTSEDIITIKLTISNGIAVPDLEGEYIEDAEQELKDLGFKKIKKEAAKKASTSKEENRVYRVAYEDPETGDWAEISGDGRLSAEDTIILYYYAPMETTQEETTARRPESSTTEAQTEAADDNEQSEESGNDEPVDGGSDE
ncbi:MAG: PASTA domain-containing protein [Clostridia bacterium]|nr:PASTA domain-containing protein [Clostridia bacterium]